MPKTPTAENTLLNLEDRFPNLKLLLATSTGNIRSKTVFVADRIPQMAAALEIFEVNNNGVPLKFTFETGASEKGKLHYASHSNSCGIRRRLSNKRTVSFTFAELPSERLCKCVENHLLRRAPASIQIDGPARYWLEGITELYASVLAINAGNPGTESLASQLQLLHDKTSHQALDSALEAAKARLVNMNPDWNIPLDGMLDGAFTQGHLEKLPDFMSKVAEEAREFVEVVVQETTSAELSDFQKVFLAACGVEESLLSIRSPVSPPPWLAEVFDSSSLQRPLQAWRMEIVERSVTSCEEALSMLQKSLTEFFVSLDYEKNGVPVNYSTTGIVDIAMCHVPLGKLFSSGASTEETVISAMRTYICAEAMALIPEWMAAAQAVFDFDISDQRRFTLAVSGLDGLKRIDRFRVDVSTFPSKTYRNGTSTVVLFELPVALLRLMGCQKFCDVPDVVADSGVSSAADSWFIVCETLEENVAWRDVLGQFLADGIPIEEAILATDAVFNIAA